MRAVTGPADYCVETEQLSKTYGGRANGVRALHAVSIAIPRATFTAVMGPSGSGKSTFLHCVAGLVRPSAGRVRLAGRDIGGLSESQLTRLRREQVGFVFQSFNLIGSLSVRQNITLPLRLAGRRPDQAWLREVIEQVGLADRSRHRPAQLSGGEQQRAAIARALVTRPAVVFADEPTGALDGASGTAVLCLLRGAVDRIGQSVVMVTHDAVAASYADTVLIMADGRLVDHLPQPSPAQIIDRVSKLRPG